MHYLETKNSQLHAEDSLSSGKRKPTLLGKKKPSLHDLDK